MYWKSAAIVVMLLAPAVTGAQTRSQEAAPVVTNKADDGTMLRARYKIVRTNGGLSGYNVIDLNVSDEKGFLDCYLTCADPGYDSGEIGHGIEGVDRDPPRLLDYVYDQIGQGNL